MTRQRRFHFLAMVLALAAGTAIADDQASRTQRVSNIDPTMLPRRCGQFLEVPVGTTSDLIVWNMRLSLAACRQPFPVAAVHNGEDLRALVASLDQGLAPSASIYRDVQRRAPTTHLQIMGAYGLGMTRVDLIVRARSAISASGAGGITYGGVTYGGSRYNATGFVDRHLALHRELEPLLVPHRDAALAAFADVARLAAADPATADANPVMRAVIADAQQQAGWLAEVR